MSEIEEKRLAFIRAVHSPIVTPPGMKRMGSEEGEQYCEGCECYGGDPYDDTPWPCETRLIADGEADGFPDLDHYRAAKNLTGIANRLENPFKE